MEQIASNNIGIVAHNDFCVGCGACVAVCPPTAIALKYSNGLFLPVIDNDACVGCGVCQKVCPSYQVDVAKSFPTFDYSDRPNECYIVQTKDKAILKKSTSGGFVTTIVSHLIQAGEYDKAYLLNFERFDGSPALIKPVNELNDILAASKSKYIPASIEQVIKDIKVKQIGRAIIVATPCQTLAIRRAITLFGHSCANEVLVIGLFCDMTMSYSIYQHFENKYGKYDELHFRDKSFSGWPGNVLIKKSESVLDIPKEERMSVKEDFKLNRCNYCFDKLNMLADISCGDCYIKGAENIDGSSNIIVRTERGRNAFENCKDLFKIQRVPFDDIKCSQRLDKKRENITRSIGAVPYVNIPFEFGRQIKSDSRQSGLSQIPNSPFVRKMRKGKRLVKRILLKPRAPYRIYIDNMGFNNRGDQLMLKSVIDQIHLWRPDAQIIVRHTVFDQNPSFCKTNGLIPLQPARRGLKGIRYKLAIQFLLNKQWLVTPSEIDLVLDCRGFQFGDKWDVDESKYLEYKRYYDSFNKRGRKLIFLPQAFGPFEQECGRKLIQLVYQQASILFARDRKSAEYLQSALPDCSRIRTCPDFTCLLHPDESASINLPEKQYVLIIPNARMIDKTDSKTSNSYFDFLIKIVQHLSDVGENVYLLNHEGPEDEKMLHKLNLELSTPLPVLTGLSGTDIKSIIKGAKLVVSSRFHGVVSGLTQGVPTLCTSWSHKYAELLSEHKCESNILDAVNIEKSIAMIDDALLYPAKYSSKEGCEAQIEKQAREMWQNVFSEIHFTSKA